MNLKKLIFGFGLSALAIGGTFASSLETLVKTLEEKKLITPQEAQQVLSAPNENEAVVTLAKILQKNKLLTEKEVEKVISSASSTSNKQSTPRVLNLSSLQVSNLEKLADLRISGVAYLHYDYTVWDTNKSNDGLNAFKVTRAYFTVRKYFNNNPNDYFRLTADIYLDTNGSNNYRLKYAYLNWQLSPHVETEIGLVHRPWIDWEEHHGWLHRDVTNTFIEEATGAHLVTSADYGIAFKGKVNNLGYLFGIYNGEGYHSSEDDRHFGKAVGGRVDYTVGRWTFAFHALYNDNDNKRNLGQADQFILHPYVSYKTDTFLVAAQYIYDAESNYYDQNGNKHSFNNWGWSINGDLHLKGITGKPITLFGRYGYWNYDSDYTHLNANNVNAYDRQQYIAGVAYQYNRYIRLSLANEYVKYDSAVKNNAGADRDYKDTVMAVMQVKW